MAKFTIEKGADLLPLSAVEALSPKDQKEYQQAAAEFVASFNAAYPDGKTVETTINKITLGERVNIVLNPTKDLSTNVYSFPYVVVDRIAADLGAGDTDGLVSLNLTTVEPLRFKTTVVAVNAGDEYETSAGETRTYKAAAIVRKSAVLEQIVLSEDAHQILAEQHAELLKDSIRNAAKARRATRAGGRAAVPAAEQVVEEADV